MIDLSSVKNVCIIRPSLSAEKREISKVPDTTQFLAELFRPRDINSDLNIDMVFVKETIINREDNDPPFEDVSHLIKQMESVYDHDHNTLFIIDPYIQATAALAKLLAGPYRGFPWSGQTMVLPKDS